MKLKIVVLYFSVDVAIFDKCYNAKCELMM